MKKLASPENLLRIQEFAAIGMVGAACFLVYGGLLGYIWPGRFGTFGVTCVIVGAVSAVIYSILEALRTRFPMKQ